MGKGRKPTNRRNNHYHQVRLGQIHVDSDAPIPELWKTLFVRILCGLWHEGPDSNHDDGDKGGPA